MNATKITNSEIGDMLISSLPTRPTAPAAFGGRGYSAGDMKAAFDRLPKFIIERYNLLIDDISRSGEGGISESIPTGIREGHTLSDLFLDITSGEMASYLTVLGASLAETVLTLRESISRLTASGEVSAESIDDIKAWLEDTEKTLSAISESNADTRSTVLEVREVVMKSSLVSDEMDIDLGTPEDLIKEEE